MSKVGSTGYGLLAVTIVIYSFVSVCSKMAAGYTLLSWHFILFYGLSVLILMVYAVLWQQVLKRFELSVAYAAKPVSTILTMFWSILLFHEQLTWKMLLGTVIILCGIWVVNSEHGT